MNDEPDPDEEIKQPTTGQIGSTFHCGGIELKPFSLAHRIAFYRISNGSFSQLETDAILIYLLTKDKKETDKVRGEEKESDFRITAFDWAEKLDAQDVMDAARSVWEDYNQATSVEPDTNSESGNG